MFSLSRLNIIQSLTIIINLPQCQEHAQTGGVGEIAFLRYKDRADCGDKIITDKCDFYFKPLKIQDGDGKVIKKIDKTSSTDDTYDVDLTKVAELQKPIQINIPTNKTVKIFASVWDDDGVFRDDKIRDIIDFKLSFDTLSLVDNWKPANKTIGTTVTFKVEYRLTRCYDNFTGLGCNFCKVNYFTQLCDKYCKPQAGNYTCNTTTGDKVCENNRVGKDCVCRDYFTGVDCNQCVEHFFPAGICNVECVPIAGQYICNDQGGKVCQENWTGSDCDTCLLHHYGETCSKYCKDTANFTCDSSGDKVCREDFYPEQVCDVHCKPEPGKYNCSDNGERLCFPNWNGGECDTCASHYFRNNCSVFCNETSNYTCSATGDKICKNNFYPNLSCDAYCKTKPGQYNCNNQGQKTCMENWNGTECDSCATNYYGTNCTKFCNTTSTNYTCDLYGNRTCNDNYYPEQQCNKYCYPVDKIYSCNQTTGDKICKGNRAGEECEECLLNYYPQGECTVFCRPAQGQYTCSSTGDKQCVDNRRGDNCSSCLDNYYGSRCEKYCKENKFYTCTDAGDKICNNPEVKQEQDCGDEEGDTEKVKDTDGDAIKGGAGAAGAILLILLVVGMFVALRIRRNRKLDKITGDALELVENPGALYATIDKKPSPRSDETLDQGDVYNKLDRNAGKSKSTPADQGNEKVEDEGMYARLNKASNKLVKQSLCPESNTEDLYNKLERRNGVETRQSTPDVKLGKESSNCDEESSYADHVVTIATKKEDTYAKFNRETLSNLINTGTEAKSENHNTASEDQEFYSRLNRFNKQSKPRFPVLSTATEEEEEDAYADVTITQQPDYKDNVNSNLDKCPDSCPDDTDTYADLEFVGKKNETGLMFSNPGATCRDDSVYITVIENSQL